VELKSNWTDGDTTLIKSINQRITVPATENISWYNPNGGKPELLIRFSVDDVTTVDDKNKRIRVAQSFSLAKVACMELDAIAGQAGAWGPKCKIKEFVIKPKGKLTPANWQDADTSYGSGSYMYTPRGVGSDKMSFILENGAGKSVYVVLELKINKWSPEE
jgi:hypothetical protein